MKSCLLRTFSGVFRNREYRWIQENRMYSSVYRSLTIRKNCALFRLLQAVFLRFLSFSVTVNSSKFKKTRVFQHSLISSGMENRLYSSVNGRFLLVFWRSLSSTENSCEVRKTQNFPAFPVISPLEIAFYNLLFPPVFSMVL